MEIADLYEKACELYDGYEKKGDMSPFYPMFKRRLLPELGIETTGYGDKLIITGPAMPPRSRKGRIYENIFGSLYHVGRGVIVIKANNSPDYHGLVVKEGASYVVKFFRVHTQEYYTASLSGADPVSGFLPEYTGHARLDCRSLHGGDYSKCGIEAHRWEFMKKWLDNALEIQSS